MRSPLRKRLRSASTRGVLAGAPFRSAETEPPSARQQPPVPEPHENRSHRSS